MNRLLLLLFALLTVVPGASAMAEKAAVPAPAMSAEQARAALQVLNDPRQRAALAATLEAIVKTHPAPGKPEAAAAATPAGPSGEAAPDKTAPDGGTVPEKLAIPFAPNSVGAEVLVTASDFVNRLGTQTMNALRTVQSIPLLWGWVVVMTTNGWARDMLIDAGWRLAVAMICSVGVAMALRRLILGPVARLEAAAPRPSRPAGRGDEALHSEEIVIVPGDGEERAEAGEVEARVVVRRRPSAWTLLRRVPIVLARLVLDLVPVLGLALVGHLIAGSALGGQEVSRLVILAVTDATAVCMALLGVARMLLSPRNPRLRLLHLPDSLATYLMRWIRRLVLLAVFGYVAGEVGLLFGLSMVAHDALQKTVGFALHVCLAIIVLQKRRAVRRWLRAPPGSAGFLPGVRNALAAVWHWIALFFLVAGWLVWAVEVRNGYAQVMHWFIVTVFILIGTRLLLLLLLGSLDRVMRLKPEIAAKFPEMEARLRLYHPVTSTFIRAVVFIVAALALLQLYGVGAMVWLLSSGLGERMLSALLTLAVTIILAFAVWESVNIALQRHLAKLQRDAQMARSARLRTLLPLLRSALLISVTVVAGLMVLSEIGVNIAPLLAGAGIIGVAIGFGSQKLVQDLINGIFLLLENAMQVGDVVKVSGLSGVVESLSVRTIRLRSEDGSVHVIPFSSVATVTNMTKDYSRAVIAVGVAYKEDFEQVVGTLKAIAKEMRAEPAWQSIILDDLEVWGLDQFGESSVTIKCRIMCTPFGRWSVVREFNRRMKQRFDEMGIEIPVPHRKLVIEGTLPAQPTLPPARVEAQEEPAVNGHRVVSEVHVA